MCPTFNYPKNDNVWNLKILYKSKLIFCLYVCVCNIKENQTILVIESTR